VTGSSELSWQQSSKDKAITIPIDWQGSAVSSINCYHSSRI